jgi:hypothetical protein
MGNARHRSGTTRSSREDTNMVAALKITNVEGLVEDGRVHRDVYASQEIFDREMELLFGRAWLMVGHESQIPNHGDFFTTRLGATDASGCASSRTAAPTAGRICAGRPGATPAA